MKFNFKSLVPHLIAVVVFLVISLAYFSPLLQGKGLQQSDIMQHKGMSKEIADFRAKNGTEPLWTNSMFGGMPAYQISVLYPANLLSYVNSTLELGLPQPANYLFLCLLGFYFLMMVLKVDYRLAIAGAIGFAFSSYFFVIIDAGHNSKAHAIVYMAPVVASVLLAYRGRLLLGGALAALFMSLEIYCNHPQITYYLLLIIGAISIGELYNAFKEKTLPTFIKAAVVLMVASFIAIGSNITSLWATYEYGKYSIRGKSELTQYKGNAGIDKNYAMGWSYGKAETMTLLIPNFMGGASVSELGTNSNLYKAFEQNGVPAQQAKQYCKNMYTYWGDQPSTAGPVYFGAIICFLFVLALFLVKGGVKWSLLAVSVFGIMLSWGNNFDGFTTFFFNYLPGFNKFRSISMALVIPQFTVPLLAFLGLRSLFIEKRNADEIKKYLLWSFYIVGGLVLIFVLLPGVFFDFIAASDDRLKSAGFTDILINALREDRQSLLRMDALRSLVFIALSFGLIWFYLKNKVKREYVFIGLSLLMLIDMWGVDKRYLNNENFVSKSQITQPFQPSEADLQIKQDSDPNYRVLNATVDVFNDASTSYFHKSIGGYHAAKMRRYQELIERQISKNNMSVLNMLNTKYFIVNNPETKQPVVQKNPGAMGNAWFVKEYKLVANADSEINALTNFNPAQTLFVDKRYAADMQGLTITADSTNTIKLTSYKPNDLNYQSSAKTEQLAVFSEIFYDKGWNAYVDGKLTPYFRGNYVLRAMRIPAGAHKIEFKFEPTVYATGEKISFASSAILLLLVAGALFVELRKEGTA
jgi:hypothetical protein